MHAAAAAFPSDASQVEKNGSFIPASKFFFIYLFFLNLDLIYFVPG